MNSKRLVTRRKPIAFCVASISLAGLIGGTLTAFRGRAVRIGQDAARNGVTTEQPTTKGGARMTPIEEIQAERQRQIKEEGWLVEHDDCHDEGQMADAAACYAATRDVFYRESKEWYEHPYHSLWPWSYSWDKRDKHDRRRQLVIAGALIVAEIERLERAGN